jgi:hypothetical protein
MRRSFWTERGAWPFYLQVSSHPMYNAQMKRAWWGGTYVYVYTNEEYYHVAQVT